MEEISLRLGHGLPFNNISKLFPEVRFYRWCNSSIDYLEFETSGGEEMAQIASCLRQFAAGVRGGMLSIRESDRLLSAVISCRCGSENSSVNMAEDAGCLWRAPVAYEAGSELLTVISTDQSMFRKFYSSLLRIGSVEVVRKKVLRPSSLREAFTLSLSDLFGSMTELQAAHLSSAASAGYFSIPKGTDIASLASRAGVSTSTLQEHLGKAESKLMQSISPYLSLYLNRASPGD